MSVKKTFPLLAIVLLVVGLAIGGGGAYYFLSTGFQSQVTQYEAQVTDLTTSILNLTATVSELESMRSAYDSQKTELETRISTLETLVTTLEDEIADLESEAPEYEEQISSLETLLDKAEDEIAEYLDDISFLETRLAYYKMLLEDFFEANPVRIGITAVNSEELQKVWAVEQIFEEEINDYSQDQGLPYKFDLVVKNNRDDVAKAVSNIVDFNSSGIKLVIGHGTSSQTLTSLLHAEERDMLMLSPSATSRDLATAGDILFRTCPTDLVQASIQAKALASWGIEGLIVIQIDNEWADEIYEILKKEYEGSGGTIVERYRYDPAIENFVGVLNTVETWAQDAIDEYGEERVAVEVIGREEVDSLISMAVNFPTVYDLKWFGSAGTTQKTSLFQSNSEEAAHLKLFGPVVTESDEYFDFATKYSLITGSTPDFYTSAMYDAAWIYALSVIETWSTETYLIEQVLADIAEDYVGASGSCRMDKYGDRLDVDHEIWGYSLDDGQLETTRYGYYDSDTGQVTWYTGVGIDPPG
jgi:ABC-type branched-subunit amino acid transport system substrate-binding protein/exonuclease VII small subunit